MSGQMCWLAGFGTSEEKILHLRLKSHEPWKPYTAFPEYRVPDYNIPRGSKGWATFQFLLKAGWEVIPSDQARVIRTLAGAAIR
jgi:hypothetical protein